jgi:hypothetical protein
MPCTPHAFIARTVALLTLALAACGGPPAPVSVPTSSPRPAAAWAASAFALDSLRLGVSIAEFGNRHRASLCDDDPIDHHARHVWFFAPCRNAQPLPDQTVLTVLTAPVAEGGPPAGEVTAIAWLGGDWPTAAGAFPVSLRAPRADVERALGSGVRLFDFADELVDVGLIVVYRHSERVYSLGRGDTTIGFVIGQMGADRTKEEWRGVVANALRRVRPRP